MASLDRSHGKAYAASFYGYQPRAVQIYNSGDSPFTRVSGVNPVTEDGYDKAVKACSQVGSIIILGNTSDYDYFTAVFDGATVNDGPGATTAGTWGALKDALASELGYAASRFDITGDANGLDAKGRWVGTEDFAL